MDKVRLFTALLLTRFSPLYPVISRFLLAAICQGKRSPKRPPQWLISLTILSVKFAASLEIEMLQYRFLTHKLLNYAFQRKQWMKRIMRKRITTLVPVSLLIGREYHSRPLAENEARISWMRSQNLKEPEWEENKITTRCKSDFRPQ